MPFQGHGSAIGFVIVSRCAAVLCDEPSKHLAKKGVGVSHPNCSYDYLKATKSRLRKASMRAEFMLMTALRCLSAMPWWLWHWRDQWCECIHYSWVHLLLQGEMDSLHWGMPCFWNSACRGWDQWQRTGDSSFWIWGTCVFGHICTSTEGGHWGQRGWRYPNLVQVALGRQGAYWQPGFLHKTMRMPSWFFLCQMKVSRRSLAR